MKFQKGVLLKNYTTFKIGGPVKYFCVVNNEKDLIKAVAFAKKEKLPFFVLGGGSNLLVSDNGYDGLVIKIQNSRLKIKNSVVTAGAGVSLAKLAAVTANAGLSGMEWSAGIPGATIGGAIRGNAGAFGAEIKDIVNKAEVLDAGDLKIKNFKNKNCHFAYRSSIFKKNPDLIILSCELLFKKNEKDEIKSKIKEVLLYRKGKHPSGPSAGSCFKNVSLKKLSSNFFKKFPKARKAAKENILPAAFLIDQCGLKGKKIGGARISMAHPNFLINSGKSKSKDVLKLINLAKRKVKNKFGIKIEEEIKLLGKF